MTFHPSSFEFRCSVVVEIGYAIVVRWTCAYSFGRMFECESLNRYSSARTECLTGVSCICEKSSYGIAS